MKTTFIITALIFTCIIMPGTSFSMNMDHCAAGKKIHKSTTGGYTFDYQLIDMTENIKKMKNMPGMANMTGTHHLMVNVTGSGDMKNAKVGFVITDPDGKKEKVMAMGMGKGFGADVNMMKKGEYKIKTKFMLGEEKLLDEFIYHVK
ncbi:MAG: hypothetical protein JRF40_14875 [Deltaproteobacteria bacterium]|nr:hypothetical protein [Deltaproteobacteria bacterium]